MFKNTCEIGITMCSVFHNILHCFSFDIFKIINKNRKRTKKKQICIKSMLINIDKKCKRI